MDEEYGVLIKDIEARSKSNQHRLDNLEKRHDDLNALATSIAELTVEQRHMNGELQEIKADIKAHGAKIIEIEKNPSKRWEKVIDCMIAAVVAAIVAYILHGGTF